MDDLTFWLDISPNIVFPIELSKFSARFRTQGSQHDLAVLLHFIVKINDMSVLEDIIVQALLKYYIFWRSGLVIINSFSMTIRMISISELEGRLA